MSGLNSLGSSVVQPSILDNPNLIAGIPMDLVPVNSGVNQSQNGANGGSETDFKKGREESDCAQLQLYNRTGVSNAVCTEKDPSNIDGNTSTKNGGKPASANDVIPETSTPNTSANATPTPSGTTGTTPAVTPPAGTATAPATLQGRDPDLIYVGEKIKLPNGNPYTVQVGDTLSGIARDHGVTLTKLIELNGFNAQLLDEYANGKLVKAHRVGDLMPGSPGSATTQTTATTTTGTPQTGTTVAPTGTTNEANADPNKPGFPAQALLDKLRALTGPVANKDQIEQILVKAAAHQTNPSSPELTADELAVLKVFMDSEGNAMLKTEPLWGGNGDQNSTSTTQQTTPTANPGSGTGAVPGLNKQPDLDPLPSGQIRA
jgi:LysM repeat protein